MLVVSTNEIPGYRIDAVLGEVFGVTVRAPNVATGLRALGGGEMSEVTQLMVHNRNEAMGRMIWQARQRRANAVVAFRFDNCESVQGWTEICAYGTAVWVAPLTDHAKQQYEAMTRAGGLPHQVPHPTNVGEPGAVAPH
ncbi:YbjQ family protein [Krasilnikovia sp. M28-CT-15]|uniref:YbjQ family protein n=1 Tax=Krasilnikovia sp. M28-CT-15 TaxID=3373540 RepID=UPI003876BD90